MTGLTTGLPTILKPGDLVFNNGSKTLSTLLGSCVSIVLWHPKLRIGGMSHYLLPKRSSGSLGPLSGLYADEVMQLFRARVLDLGTLPEDYFVWAYGGANMFPNQYKTCTDQGQVPTSLCDECPSSRVSCHNCHAAFSLTQKHGFLIREAELGGNVCRTVTLNTEDGYIKVKRTDMTALNTESEKQLFDLLQKTGGAS